MSANHQIIENEGVSISKKRLAKIKKKTLTYKGNVYGFNIYCRHCNRTVFTSSQIIEGRRTDNEQKGYRDWIVLCTNCWKIIDSGKKIHLI
ncbi:MAG: hypothetical protein A3F94_00265 [Candidatus Spechtbacteria bacterium RIFCSPLOWO2_12_FULL_38_22]|uniref:Uncharacterized protein n=1 Tax=Candidatus Spechtbacteria bacterium RIFCSPLOWO2_12_FULL_38_22 TaxID=1802165 RepID=A0A1G2HH39_9BACT|nr:MAG: hypothetical protein A3F94_00265 [Candidatus Spechtbacteria bacterium RIFCSPLOWO2_12_FULL_38_22]